jgi:hypothetical protein
MGNLNEIQKFFTNKIEFSIILNDSNEYKKVVNAWALLIIERKLLDFILI